MRIFGVLFISTLAFFSTFVFAQEEEPKTIEEELPTYYGDVRGFVWGLPKEIILETEEAQPLGEFKGVLVYKGYDQDYEAFIQYYFSNDLLYKAEIEYDYRISTPPVLFEDYLKIRDSYIEAFGEPLQEDLDWSDDEYKDRPEEWGRAVSRGHLRITTIWSLDDTIIRMVNKGYNFKSELKVTYNSKKALQVKQSSEFDPAPIR